MVPRAGNRTRTPLARPRILRPLSFASSMNRAKITSTRHHKEQASPNVRLITGFPRAGANPNHCRQSSHPCRASLSLRTTHRQIAPASLAFCIFGAFRRQAREQKGSLSGPFAYGARRARTGDLLGAIYARSFVAFRHRPSSVSTIRICGHAATPSFAMLRHGYLTKT